MGRKSKEQLETERAEAQIRFDEAVAKGAAAAIAAAIPALRAEVEKSVLSEIASARVEAGTVAAPTSETDGSFAKGLALAIAQLSSQGTGKKPYVAPEVLEKQAEAKQHMISLLVKARAEGVMPGYRLTIPMYLSERLLQPQWRDDATKQMKDTEVNWAGIPDQSMQPLDETAAEIYAAYLNSIGAVPPGAPSEAPMINHNGTLVRGMNADQRAQVRPASAGMDDPRRIGGGAPKQGKYVNILGSIADPAVVS